RRRWGRLDVLRRGGRRRRVLLLLRLFLLRLFFFLRRGGGLVVRLERGPLARLHRDEVDLRLLVEKWFRLARSPRARDRGHEVAIGEEVQPLAIGRPFGTVAVVAVG